jgi:ubiquinone biosynthesis protein UbiJ
MGRAAVMQEHPTITQTRRDLEMLKERKRRLEAGELPGVDASDGQPPQNPDFREEIDETEARIAELAAQLESMTANSA